MIKRKRILKSLAQKDKEHIKRFLKVHNVELQSNRISMLFKEEEIECKLYGGLINYKFIYDFRPIELLLKKPYWVKVELKYAWFKKNHFDKIVKVSQLLINKIVQRDWPVNPNESKKYLEPCHNTQQLNGNVNFDVDWQNRVLKMVLIANINFEI